jgi:hypothetical protein
MTILEIIQLYLKHISETGFCLRLQVEPIQLGPIDKATVSGPVQRSQFPKRRVLNKRHDDG